MNKISIFLAVRHWDIVSCPGVGMTSWRIWWQTEHLLCGYLFFCCSTISQLSLTLGIAPVLAVWEQAQKGKCKIRIVAQTVSASRSDTGLPDSIPCCLVSRLPTLPGLDAHHLAYRSLWTSERESLPAPPLLLVSLDFKLDTK